MVECTALEMRHRCKPIGGSNPSLSAIRLRVQPLDIGCKAQYARLRSGRLVMKRWVVAFAVLLCALAGFRSAEARGPYGSISVGNWKGGAFTNDQTGEFSHCGATAIYQSGIIFVVMIDGTPSWSLGFAHDKWSLSGGQAFPIALTFDGGPAVNVHGVAISNKLVRVPMPDNSVVDQPIPESQVDDGLCAGPAVPVQSGSNRAASAVAYQLRRQSEEIWGCQRRRHFRCRLRRSRRRDRRPAAA